MSSRVWPSVWVAAGFAIHPLGAESVAWIAERKDVLSGLFFILTLGAYVGYVKAGSRERGGGSGERAYAGYAWYAAVVVLFALGLMCKPMLVSLPFVLLLLDYWPLGRGLGAGDWGLGTWSTEGGRSPQAQSDLCNPLPTVHYPQPTSFLRLVVEKIPFSILAAVSCAVTLSAQRRAMDAMPSLALPWRVANAMVACVGYLFQFLWPANLAVLYPHPREQIPLWKSGICLLLIVVASAAVLRRRREHPYLLVGWFWYLVMLLPVIGLVQVGRQAMADHYTYLPLLGIHLACAWRVRALLMGSPTTTMGTWCPRRAVCAFVCAAVLMVWLAMTWRQVSFWRNSETLWARTLQCTTGNYVAHNQMAGILAERGELAAAIVHWKTALEIEPNHLTAQENLARALLLQGSKSPDGGTHRKE